MKKSKKLFALVCAVCMVGGLLAGCGGGAQPSSPPAEGSQGMPVQSVAPADPAVTYKDTVKIAQVSEIANGAYYNTTTTQQSYVAMMTHDKLFELDYYSNEVIPEIATEAVDINGDGITWKVTLNQGIMFHTTEGEPYSELTSADIKFTHEYISTEAGKVIRVSAFADAIESMECPDDYTIIFTMKSPTFDFPLRCTEVFMLCEKAVTEMGDIEGQEVGSGCYYINYDESTPGQQWTMTRYDDYWGGIENHPTKNIVFVIRTDLNTGSAALQSGEVDMLQSPGATIALELEAAGMTTASVPAMTQCFIQFNSYETGMFHGEDEEDTIKLRQAIQYAIDKDALCAIIYATNPTAGTRIDSCFGSRTAGYVDLGPTEFNLDKARALMEELGYSESNRLHMDLAHYASYATYAQIVQDQLKQIYIDVECVTLDTSVFGSTLRTGEGWDICVNYFGSATSMASDLMKLMHSNGSLAKTYGWNSDVLDAKINEVLALPTYEEQLEAFGELQEFIREYVPYICTHTGTVQISHKPNVEGVVVCPTTSMQNYTTVRIPEN